MTDTKELRQRDGLLSRYLRVVGLKGVPFDAIILWSLSGPCPIGLFVSSTSDMLTRDFSSVLYFTKENQPR